MPEPIRKYAKHHPVLRASRREDGFGKQAAPSLEKLLNTLSRGHLRSHAILSCHKTKGAACTATDRVGSDLDRKRVFGRWLRAMEEAGHDAEAVLQHYCDGLSCRSLDRARARRNGWARKQIMAAETILEKVATNILTNGDKNITK